jgi:hypothetical protein
MAGLDYSNKELLRSIGPPAAGGHDLHETKHHRVGPGNYDCAFEQQESIIGPAMFRFLFRFLGLVLLTLGFLILVHDGTKSIADQTVYITKVGPAWENIHQKSLKALEPVVEKLAGTWAWSNVIQPYFLNQPAALVVAIVGGLLILLGQTKRRG